MIKFNQLPCEISEKICDIASDAWLIDLVEDLYDLTQHGYQRTGSPEVLTKDETDEYIRKVLPVTARRTARRPPTRSAGR